jgi:hypothetical protein
MKKTVKPPGLITILLLCFNFSNAQLKLPVINGIGNDIKKVIAEYPGQFSTLMGEEVARNPQSTEYLCNFKVNGAEESSVTKYVASKKMVCSWQAVMLTTESFEKAKQKYKSLFAQLNNLEVNVGGKKYKLHGRLDAPVNGKKFFSSVFTTLPAEEAVKKLKAEVLMQYSEPMEWKVKVLVYEQEKEDAKE